MLQACHEEQDIQLKLMQNLEQREEAIAQMENIRKLTSTIASSQKQQPPPTQPEAEEEHAQQAEQAEEAETSIKQSSIRFALSDFSDVV